MLFGKPVVFWKTRLVDKTLRSNCLALQTNSVSGITKSRPVARHVPNSLVVLFCCCGGTCCLDSVTGVVGKHYTILEQKVMFIVCIFKLNELSSKTLNPDTKSDRD